MSVRTLKPHQNVRCSNTEKRPQLIARLADMRFASISILLHVFLVLLGGSVVLFKIIPKTEDFVAGDGSLVNTSDPMLAPPVDILPNAALPQFSAASPAAPSLDVIVTNTLTPTSFAVSATAPVPQINDTVAKLQSRAFGKLGGMDGGVGGVKGGTRTLFGMTHTADSVGLVGTFYDFKRDSEGKPVAGKGRAHYAEIIRGFVKGKPWSAPDEFPHFTSQTRLNTKLLAFKGIPDVQAGAAFGSPETKPGQWVAHYAGEVEVMRGGSYRLVGWGDNCLVVGFNGKVVLDASDRGYTGEQRHAVGKANLPGKPNAALFEGDWFDVRAGERLRVDMLIGDEGGIFSAGVLIQAKDVTYASTQDELPDLPVFLVGKMDAAEVEIYDFIPRKNLETVIFRRVKGGMNTASF